MRARGGGRVPAVSRRGRWRGASAVRTGHEDTIPGLRVIVAFVVFVCAAIGGYAIALDSQLRGGLLAQRAEAAQRADWVALEQLPRYLPLAFLVAIDPTFLQRNPLGMGAEGATLSQELARQVHRLEDGLGGQARELVMGPLLEARLSEAELLELYLNRVYLGEDGGWRIYGVHHAAREYLGKTPDQLTLGEAATLAGLLLPPRIHDPRARVGAVGIRRSEVLRQMVDAGVISAEEYAAALEEPLGFQPGPVHHPMSRPAGWDRDPDVIRIPSETLAPEEAPAP
jgi:membrane peptidoglycan carboxypeptidase